MTIWGTTYEEATEQIKIQKLAQQQQAAQTMGQPVNNQLIANKENVAVNKNPRMSYSIFESEKFFLESTSLGKFNTITFISIANS